MSYIVKPVSQFSGYPVKELKAGWLSIPTIFLLATENLNLK